MATDFKFDSVREALAAAIKRKGIAPTTLSLQVGKSKSLVKDILDDGNDIKLSTLAKLAGALDMDVRELIPGDAALLPNAAVLTSAFAVLLDSVGIDPYQDERAQKLARQFPNALQRVSTLRADLIEDGATTLGEGALDRAEDQPAA